VSVEHARLTVLVGCTNYQIYSHPEDNNSQQQCEHDMLPVGACGTALFPETTTIDTELHSLCLLPIHHLSAGMRAAGLRPNDCCLYGRKFLLRKLRFVFAQNNQQRHANLGASYRTVRHPVGLFVRGHVQRGSKIYSIYTLTYGY
jgi:hypothetical protein